MTQWHAAALEKFQGIIEPFTIHKSYSAGSMFLGLLVLMVTIYICYRYLYLSKNRRLVMRLKKINRECRRNQCSPELALRAIHQVLNSQTSNFNSVQKKIDRYRFSKISPSVQNISELLKTLESLLTPKNAD